MTEYISTTSKGCWQDDISIGCRTASKYPVESSWRFQSKWKKIAEEPWKGILENYSELEIEFIRLADNWKKETRGISSLTKKILNHNYQRIIALGPKVIPIIMRKMKKEPDHWFWALRFLCNINPIKKESEGNIVEMTNDWLKWGADEGYI